MRHTASLRRDRRYCSLRNDQPPIRRDDVWLLAGDDVRCSDSDGSLHNCWWQVRCCQVRMHYTANVRRDRRYCALRNDQPPIRRDDVWLLAGDDVRCSDSDGSLHNCWWQVRCCQVRMHYTANVRRDRRYCALRNVEFGV